MGLFDEFKTPNTAPPATPSPTGSLFANIKTPVASVAPTVGGLFANVKTPTSPKLSPYFYTKNPDGSTIGQSDDLDVSGKPFLGYRNPGDTATTTDRTRMATTFDPRTPQKLDLHTFLTARMPSGTATELKQQMGGSYSDELDHKIALELAGSNDKSNLQIQPGRQGGAAATSDKVENSLAQEVVSGKKSLFQAQTELAQQKGLPTPWVGDSNHPLNQSIAGINQPFTPEEQAQNEKDTSSAQLPTTPPSIKTDESTPLIANDPTATLGKFLKTLFVEPYTAKIPFNKGEQTFPYGGEAMKFITNAGTWVANAPVAGGAVLASNLYALKQITHGTDPNNTKPLNLPFNGDYFGLPEGTKLGNTVQRMTDDFSQRMDADPKHPVLNGLMAIVNGPINDLFMGESFANTFIDPALRATLAVTGYNREALDALHRFEINPNELKQLDPNEAGALVRKQAVEKTQAVLEKYGPFEVNSDGKVNFPQKAVDELNQVSQDFSVVRNQYYAKAGVSINPLGSALRQAADVLSRPVSTLGITFPYKTTPSFEEKALPGYKQTYEKSFPAGLSTQPVEPVGFGEEKPTFYHGADAETAANIRANGFQPSKDFPGSGMVSLSTDESGAQNYANLNGKGEVLPVSVNAKNTKVYDSMDEYENAIEAAPGETAGEKEINLNRPYDLVTVKNGGGPGKDAVFANPNAVSVKDAAATVSTKPSTTIPQAASAGAVESTVTPSSPEQAATVYKKNVIDPAIAKGQPTIIGADDLKDHFGKDYNDANHSIYSKAAFQLYDQALKENPADTVIFTGGGPGSGKTELITDQFKNDGFKGIVYDSNFSNLEGAKKQIEMARAAGKKVKLFGVIANPEKARGFTIQRENKTGRAISDKTFAQGHVGFPDVARQLLEDGTLKPEEVKLFDMRTITDFKEAIKKVALNVHESNPLATLNKIRYNKEEFKNTYGKQNYNSITGAYIRQPELRQSPHKTPLRNRPDQGNAERGRNKKLLGRSAASERTIKALKSFGTPGESRTPDTLIRKQGPVPSNRDNAIIPKTDESVKPVQANEKPSRVRSPLEHHLSELEVAKKALEESLNNNPAKALAKFAHNGELPEVLGGDQGKFGKMGDDIAHELGFPDSETARLMYQSYRVQQKRLTALKIDIQKIKDVIAKNKLEDKDAKSLKFFLEKHAKLTEKEVAKIASAKAKPSGIQEDIQLRQKLGEEHLEAVLQATYSTTPPLEREAPQHLLQLTQEAYNIPAEEFERIGLGDPYNQIIINSQTSVKAKVGIIDYFRTPDRVLKKLGLDTIAAALRRSYEGYLTELPVQLDLITDWKNRVTDSGGNKRIFRWLDGQYNRDFHAGKAFQPLGDEELKVAHEIRGYLQEWAARLGLPEDNQISHYITHIFSLGENEKEFDEDVAKIIRDKVPGSVYDPFLEKRLGKKGYIEDTWKALDAYVKRAVRKANMDPALERLKEAAKHLEDSQERYIKRLGDRINLRPTEIDNLIDNTFKQIIGYRFGQRPVAFLSSTARRIVYRAMLGLNFGSAIKNLTQGVNTYAKLGEKYTTIGYAKLLTKIGNDELERVGVLKQDLIQDRALSAAKKTMENVDKGLYVFFDTAEKINRGAAYWGAKQKAIDNGATEEQAIVYAKKLVRDTQFAFGSIDTPVGLNSDITKLLAQFTSYGFKQTEFVTEMLQSGEWSGIFRYLVASAAMTYFVGKIFNIKWTDFVPGYSIVSRFGALPPTFAIPTEITKAVFGAPDRFGNVPPWFKPKNKGGPTRFKNILNTTATGALPAGVQGMKIYQGLKTYNDPKKNIQQNPYNLTKAILLGSQNLSTKSQSSYSPAKKKSSTPRYK